MSRAGKLAQKSAAKSEPAFKAPAETQKMMSVRLPVDRHRILKTACASKGIPIRSLFLAVIAEIDSESDAGQALLEAAAKLDTLSLIHI